MLFMGAIATSWVGFLFPDYPLLTWVGPSDELNQQTTQHHIQESPCCFCKKKNYYYVHVTRKLGKKNLKKNFFYYFSLKLIIWLNFLKFWKKQNFCQFFFYSKNIEKKTLGQDQTNWVTYYYALIHFFKKRMKIY
jgi:hypothetical protein